jgi:hypothetical protein
VALGEISADPLSAREDEDPCGKVVLLAAAETDSAAVAVTGEGDVVLATALPELEGKSEDMTDDPI